MGIPSYYKKLIDTIPGLKKHKETDVNWLFMDFNCLIYHTLHRADTPAYFGDEQREEWETKFLNCIVEYSLKVIKQVNPKVGVFIAIDGVVPMAKMRQQRLRRFKSVWQTKHPQNGESAGVSWDKNSITPGTLFMKKLRSKLENMISKHGKKSWALSSSDEAGEGEHKIVAEWRKGTYKGNFAVYGLDADLIVLSILGQECCQLNNNIWLFREEINAGKISYDSDGEEVFEWFSINALRDWLANDFTSGAKRQFILNYCFAMSILGNDFLPTSLSLKIRDDGHSELLDILRNQTNNGLELIDTATLKISLSGLKTLFKMLTVDEPNRIYKYIHRKCMMSKNIEDELNLGDNNWPLSHIEEKILIRDRQLIPNWQEKYMTTFFMGYDNTRNNINKICSEYLYGIQWIWAYYTGQNNDVCFNWFYPFNLPPLWSWLSEYLEKVSMLPVFPNKILVKAQDIKPIEQLSLVLPLESWSLIPQCPEKNLPYLAPQFFPAAFMFESVGKRFFWECESLIPLPTIYEIKEIIRNNL
jgi:5'-3' exonuclease